MKTRIQPLSKKQIIDYQDKTVENFWLLPDNAFSIKPTDEYQNKFTYLLKNIQNAVICIQTAEISHPELKKALERSVQQNNRIYLLTNQKPDFLKDLCGTMLMRYGMNLTGSFILVNPANNKESEGIFFNAPLTEPCLLNRMYECLDLSKNQIQTLYHFFLYNFWYRASHEILDDFNTPQTVSKENIPVFVPEPTQTFTDSAYILQEIQQIKEKAQVITPFINPTHTLFDFATFKNCTFKTSFTAINPENVLTLAQNQNSIQANPDTQIVSNIILTEHKSYLLSCTTFNSEDIVFALPLEATQKTKTEKKYTELNFTFATFTKHKTRKELKDKKIAYLGRENERIRIQAVATIDLKAVYPDNTKLTDKATFESYVPELIDDDCSCQIEYTWKNTPFYLPAKAQKHTLYHTWDTYCAHFETFANNIIKQIETTKEKQSKTLTGKISSFWQGFKRTFLSKETKFEGKTDELQKLLEQKEQLPYFALSERNKIITQLNSIASEINADVQEIEVEIQKTEIREKIQELKTELEITQTEFENWNTEQLRAIEQKEAEKQSKINAKQQEIKTLKEAFAEWDKQEKENVQKQEQQKQEKLAKLLDKNGFKMNELSKFKNQLQERTGKKNKEKNPKDAEEAEETMKQLREIEAVNPNVYYETEKKQKENEINNAENELKELGKLNTKGNYEQEKKKKQDKIEDIDAQIRKKEKELENAGKNTENKNSSSGLDEVIGISEKEHTKKNTASFDIPQSIKPLPKSGELYTHAGNTFLAVEYWEEYKNALEDAESFDAVLCAKKS